MSAKAPTAEPWVELLCVILRETCRGRWDDFDCADGGSIARAVAVCERCPERLPCTSWAASRKDMCGVLGGSYKGHYSDKPSKHEGTQ